MAKTENPPRQRYVLPVALGALAALGVGAVLYGKPPPTGKAVAVCPPASTALAAKLAPLAKGDLAALAISSEPRRAQLLAFESEGGHKLTLADFRGRAVLLNLWATWCAPCRVEMPALDRLQAAAGGRDFEVVAIDVDTARLERRDVFLDHAGVKTLTRYADPSGEAFEVLRRDGKALGLPVTMLIDQDGCEVGAIAGAVNWDSVDAQALIGALRKG